MLTAGRGRYDRRQTVETRRQERRRALVRAAAEQLGRGPSLNVNELIRSAGVDRNAYYEWFGSAAALELAVIEHARRRLSSALEHGPSRTPAESLRQWLKQWIAFARHERALVRACLNCSGRAALVDLFVDRLEEWSEAATDSGLIGGTPDALRVWLLASAITDAAELAAQRKAAELAGALTDLVLRQLR